MTDPHEPKATPPVEEGEVPQEERDEEPEPGPKRLLALTSESEETRSSEFYEPYRGFAQLLRRWLMGYGIGMAALIVSQKEVREHLVALGAVEDFLALFLMGVGAQLLMAFLYKYAMQVLYHAKKPAQGGIAEGEETTPSLPYRAADWLSTAVLFEAMLDVITIGMFMMATLVLARAISLPDPQPKTAPPPAIACCCQQPPIGPPGPPKDSIKHPPGPPKPKLVCRPAKADSMQPPRRDP